MQLSRTALKDRWAWTTAAAIIVWAVLYLADSTLRQRTGYGTVDLQGVADALTLRVIIDHWSGLPDAALAGFNLGFDYLFMPLYGAALYFGAIAARERFAPRPGARRRVMAILAMAPVAGALCDAAENALQLAMIFRGPTQSLAALAYQATYAKFAGVLVGLVLTLAALAGMALERRTKKAADEKST